MDGGLAIINDICAQSIGFRISPKELAPAVMAMLMLVMIINFFVAGAMHSRGAWK